MKQFLTQPLRRCGGGRVALWLASLFELGFRSHLPAARAGAIYALLRQCPHCFVGTPPPPSPLMAAALYIGMIV